MNFGRRSCVPIKYELPLHDEDPAPIPVRPWEPPGPPARRRITFGRPMVIFWAIVAVALLGATLFMCVPGPYGGSPG